MLTEEYLKEHFVDAYFIDNERQNIEILHTNEDRTKVHSTIVPFDEKNHMYKALSKIRTLEDLHETTYARKKEERQLFVDQVKKIAEEEDRKSVVRERV
mgnify:CR=1 FL=1